MLEHARHLPRRRRHTGDGHYRMPINLQNLVRTIVDDGVTRSCTAITRNQNAAGKFERKDRCRLGRLPRLLLRCCLRHRTERNWAEQTFRRSSEGKSSSAPETFWSNPNCERSITDQCAGDSAWIGWDRLCAFSLTDPLCPVAKRPANAGHRHRLVLVPTGPVPLAFECAQA